MAIKVNYAARVAWTCMANEFQSHCQLQLLAPGRAGLRSLDLSRNYYEALHWALSTATQLTSPSVRGDELFDFYLDSDNDLLLAHLPALRELDMVRSAHPHGASPNACPRLAHWVPPAACTVCIAMMDLLAACAAMLQTRYRPSVLLASFTVQSYTQGWLQSLMKLARQRPELNVDVSYVRTQS